MPNCMGLTVVQQAAELQGPKVHNVTDAARKGRMPLLCLEGAVVQHDVLSPDALQAGRGALGLTSACRTSRQVGCATS
jgi:hypothetical protein